VKYLLALLASLAIAAPAWAQCDDSDRDADSFSCRAGDCDDTQATVYPGAPELCDGRDNNCDTLIDNRPDGDADGVTLCQGDCDDANNRRFPGNPEVCDGVDNDCSAATPDSAITRSCYGGPAGTAGRGICRAGTETCNGPMGWSGMCAGEVRPAAEICDNIDQDCDGSNTNGAPDADSDGTVACFDCDDNNNRRFPGNPEICDGLDNDCNNGTQDASLTRACYSGPMGTAGRGICRAGTESCSGAAGWSGTCNGQVLPETETCDAADRDCDGNPTNGAPDADGDGRNTCTDCDDNNNRRFPGNPEVCDGLDNDCNAGTLDTSLTRACYSGPMGTAGRGLCRAGSEACNGTAWSMMCTGEVTPQPELCDAPDQDCNGSGYNGFPNADNDPVPACAGDCDDNDNRRYPGNAEICDGVDNDCDNIVDENFDRDGDGVTTCGGDCNDNNPNIYPGAPEVCNGVDDDCDGMIDDGFTDMDGDGFRACGPNPDCDDTNAARFPGNPELCDSLDNDCDTLVDERNAQGQPLRRSCYSGPGGTNGIGLCRSGNVECIGGNFNGACVGQVVPRTEQCDRADDDCDGRVDEDFDVDMDGVSSCAMPADCDDNDRNARPGGTETCDGRDNDCDGTSDENLSRACYSGPMGTEGVGPCRAGAAVCVGAAGYSMTCTGEVVPAAQDTCNAIDDDCDGTVDEGFDQDGDGVTTCAGDCNDMDPAVRPGAIELCNGVDDNCDRTVDGTMTPCYTGPVGTATVGACHPGMGVCMNGQPGMCSGEQTPVAELCDQVDNDCDGDVDEGFDGDSDGVTSCSGDCDDTNPFKAAGQAERCDCDDNDCDGMDDEDGFGGSVCQQGACHDFDADGFTNCDGDCADRNPAVNPAAAELCGNQVDDDCDSVIDENVDADGDGVSTCDGDCDDRFAQIKPGAVEVCDAFDNDCDGQTDEGFDQDGDFATTCAGDCNDGDRNQNPFRREVCGNSIDDDCDGVVDPDVDEDGDGATTCGGDCNDFNAAVRTGLPEICDGQDNDCDNQVDEGFDLDRDTFATCFGDCDDNDRTIGPFARERADAIDNNCDGRVDEGSDDADGDGYSFLCGDCQPGDPAVGPQSPEICDGRDNDCDGVIDRDVRGRSVCQSCNDVDNDGIQDCDGDCDDTRANVKPGGTEVCDGIDNDCNGSVDLDRITRENLCTNVDGGVRPDTGVGADTGRDGDGSVASDAAADAGVAPDAARLIPVARVECGCRAVAPVSSSRTPWPWLLALAGVLAVRRRRRAERTRGFVGRAVGLLVVGVVASTQTACTDIRVPAEPDSGATALDVGGRDAATPDVAPPVDTGPRERPDGGPWSEGPCRLADPDVVRVVDAPGRTQPWAAHRQLTLSPLSGGAQGYAFDDASLGLRGFFVRRALGSRFDSRDPTAAGQVIDQVLDPVMRGVLPGVVGVPSRVDETVKTVFSRESHPASRTLRSLTYPNDVLVSRVRDGLLAALVGAQPTDIGGLPDVTGELAERQLTLAAFVDVDGSTTAADILVALVPEAATASAAIILADLTNGTHLGPAGATLGLSCDTATATALQVDFVWVVDNSASMQEEQQALAQAADTFFAALQRSRIDFRLGVVTTDGEALRGGGFTRDLDTFKARVRVGINGNGQEQGLEYALRALERASTATEADARLRPEAVPVVVFYTDEESSNLRTIPAYTEGFGDLGALPFAICGPRPRGCQAVGRGAARVGELYIQLVESLGGGVASICAEDLTRPIEQVLIAAAGAASRTRLSERPISGAIEVQLPDRLIPRGRVDGFDYESTANTLLFYGNAAPPEGTTFRAAYLRWQPFIP
jgi:hypothetical protein